MPSILSDSLALLLLRTSGSTGVSETILFSALFFFGLRLPDFGDDDFKGDFDFGDFFGDRLPDLDLDDFFLFGDKLASCCFSFSVRGEGS